MAESAGIFLSAIVRLSDLSAADNGGQKIVRGGQWRQMVDNGGQWRNSAEVTINLLTNQV